MSPVVSLAAIDHPETKICVIRLRFALERQVLCNLRLLFLCVLRVSVVKLFGCEGLGYTVSGREACFCG